MPRWLNQPFYWLSPSKSVDGKIKGWGNWWSSGFVNRRLGVQVPPVANLLRLYVHTLLSVFAGVVKTDGL